MIFKSNQTIDGVAKKYTLHLTIRLLYVNKASIFGIQRHDKNGYHQSKLELDESCLPFKFITNQNFEQKNCLFQLCL